MCALLREVYMIFVNDILKRCKEKGHKMSRMGIYVAGKRVGFIYKDENGYQLDKEKFENWLEKAVEKIPDNYLSAKQIMKEYKVSQSEAYCILNDADSESEKFGSYGVLYAERNRIEKVIEKRSRKHTYNW